MVNEITPNMRLCEIISRPEFTGMKHHINPATGLIGKAASLFSLSTIAAKAGTWNADSMAAGLNYLSKLCDTQEVLYDIWPQEEQDADPAKARTGLFALTLKQRRKFVLICAGGAYSSVATIVEGFPVAKRLNEMGYAAFTLTYRTKKAAHFPNPLDDLAAALRFIINNAETLNIDLREYALMGFSAGGHLVSNFGRSNAGYARYGLPRPAAVILAYPVISIEIYAHHESRKNILGSEEKSITARRKYSVERHVDSDYPPTFIWYCESDDAVDSNNSKILVRALKESNVPCMFKRYQGDAHGWGLADDTIAEGWLKDAVGFWESNQRNMEV